VRENLIFTDKESSFLRELIREKVEFIIVGLSAAALQGAPVVTQDVDLWFKNLGDPGIGNALRKVGGVYVPPFGANGPMFAGDAVRLFDVVTHMHGLGPFDDEMSNTVKIHLGRIELNVLSLERIIKSKEAAGRQKDKLALPVLADALIAIRSALGNP
jgi:hypothetical protein